MLTQKQQELVALLKGALPTAPPEVAQEMCIRDRIMEAETFDGYVIFRALDKPDISFNVRFVGV